MAMMFFAVALALLAILSGLLGYRAAVRGRCVRLGAYGLGVLALLFAGLWLAGHAGKEVLAYGFGIALMLALPALLVAGVAAALGAVIRRRQSKDQPR